MSVMQPRFPLSEHAGESLLRSLTSFIQYAYDDCLARMEALRPHHLTREEWADATDEAKAFEMQWQSNLRYLRQRLRYYMEMMQVKSFINSNRANNTQDVYGRV